MTLARPAAARRTTAPVRTALSPMAELRQASGARRRAPVAPSPPLPITAVFTFNPPARSISWPAPPEGDRADTAGSESPQSKAALRFGGLALEGKEADGDAHSEGGCGAGERGSGCGVSLPGQPLPQHHHLLPNRSCAEETPPHGCEKRDNNRDPNNTPSDRMDVDRGDRDRKEDAPSTMHKRKRPGPFPRASAPGMTPPPANDQVTPAHHDGTGSQQIPHTKTSPGPNSPGRKRAKSSSGNKRTMKKAKQEDDDKVEEDEDEDADEDEDEDEREIVDPVRAALTWQEDEITVYDPDDADDDGTGMDGVGFQPTPALARATAQKKRRQLAEYRRMLESEARAGRSRRRRGGGTEADAGGEEGAGRVPRVRFVEPGPTVTSG